MAKFKSVKLGNTKFDPIQLGGYKRKFNGLNYYSSSSYQTKAQAAKQANYLKENSIRTRVVKYKKGYVVFSNSQKTGGKLKPRKRKNKR